MSCEIPIEIRESLEGFIAKLVEGANDPEHKGFPDISCHITELPGHDAIIFHGNSTVLLTKDGDRLTHDSIGFENSAKGKTEEPLFSLVLWDCLFFFFWESPVVRVKLGDFLSDPKNTLRSNELNSTIDMCKRGLALGDRLFVVDSGNHLSSVKDIDWIGTPLCADTEICSIAVGKHHLVCVATSGKVFGLGDNEYGQCGISLERKATGSLDHLEEIVLSGVTGESFFPVKVSCGYNHSCVLSNDGSLLTFGDNSYGQLCRRDPNPLGLASIALVRGVACAANYSVCTRTPDESDLFLITDLKERAQKFKDILDVTVQLVGFGLNSHGQLANGEKSIGLALLDSPICLIQTIEDTLCLTDQCELVLLSAHPEFLLVRLMCGDVYLSGKFFAEDVPRAYLMDCPVLTSM